MDNIGSLALPMPPLPDQQEVAYVFGDMPFHGLNQNGSRRHSLRIIQRRNSLMAQSQSATNSALIPNTSENDLNNAQAVQASHPQPEDTAFFHEMDMITSPLWNSDIADQEMVEALDKLFT